MSSVAAIGGAALRTGFCRVAAVRHATVLAIAASVVLPIDSVAPPTSVRTGCCRTAPRTLARRARRTKRRSRTEGGGGGEEEEEDGFSGDGDGDDGPFGGGGGWSGGFGGGRGWNPDGLGGDPDGDELRSSSSDEAFDLFVHEVLGWAALSSCAHFAYKRIGRFLTDREKAVPVPLVQPIC